jgi:hypothetical protein
VVVIEHHGGCVVVEDRSHHFAGVHAAATERAAKEVLQGNQSVGGVEM